MIKILKIVLVFAIIIAIIWGFSDSYSSHNIDNIVHVVAIGIDKCDDEKNNLKVSFQFVNVSSESGNSSGGNASTVVTSINAATINTAINLMNSYIGKELNFAHCKVIVFSEEFARDGIKSEICTFINNEEIRPATNIVISTSEANSYLKNSNPNIEKLVTNYYDTFELTSNFTGYSDDITLGRLYNKLLDPESNNTAILGRTFQKVSNSSQSGESSSGSGQSENQSQGASQGENQNSENQDSATGESSAGNNSEADSGGAALEISGERGTQNVGIAVFKDDKYVGQLSEIDSICHLLITNNVDSFVFSVPMENYPENILDLNISPIRGSKISINVSSQSPQIYVTLYCKGKVLTIDDQSVYEDPGTLKNISDKAAKFLEEQIKAYLYKTSKEFKSDIAGFSNNASIKFLTVKDWENYDWSSKYENAEFIVNVELNVVSSLLFSNSQ